MPRKRKTKAVVRAKPERPSGDEGSGIPKEELMKKLQAFILDHDTKIERYIENLECDRRSVLCFVEKGFTMELTKLPSVVRKMTVAEVVDAGGTYEALLSQLEKIDGQSEIYDQQSSAMSRIMSTVSNFKTRKAMIETIPEEAHGTVEKNSRKTRANARNKNTANGASKGSFLQPLDPPSTIRNSRFRTPGYQPLGMTGWETPIVTPKFDPRLPITPALARKANPGEVCMSLAGSPIMPEEGQEKNGAAIKIRGKYLKERMRAYNEHKL
ncbi:hypothetical protein CHS0354_031047 [Potamilus streckersoni]|uniref:Borealin N-terminal domain-containing protein n=1 Tax=Potamilus streckersoni TaxID=2493646 RepID=A0AAE0TDN9_9BIVA|nr:hypothetical protein CHS0354_031047 [Potamilus streckersoni]